MGQNSILHNPTGPEQPVVEDGLYCCQFSLEVWLHHPASEGKCVITNKEVEDISVTTLVVHLVADQLLP